MIKNVGQTDKIIRIVLGIVLIALDFFEIVQGMLSWVLGIVGIVLIITAFLNFCPLYRIIGQSTCPVEKK